MRTPLLRSRGAWKMGRSRLSRPSVGVEWPSVLEPFIFLLELLFFEHKLRAWVLRVLRVRRRVVLLVPRSMELAPVSPPPAEWVFWE